MSQGTISSEQQVKDKLTYPEMFKHRLTTDAGFHYKNRGFAYSTHSEVEREALFEELWAMVNGIHSQDL
jgi:hypothetical protein